MCKTEGRRWEGELALPPSLDFFSKPSLAKLLYSPLNHIHVGDADRAGLTAAQAEQGKVLQEFTANGAGPHHKVVLGAQLLLKVGAKHGNLTVIPELQGHSKFFFSPPSILLQIMSFEFTF